MSENDIPIEPSGNGKVKSFAGSGINATFETQKEIDEHQDWLDERAAQDNPMPIRQFRVKTNSMRN